MALVNNRHLYLAKRKKHMQILDIPKLKDAKLAGGHLSYKCTLILTAGGGNSLSALALAGIDRREFYGVFSLRDELMLLDGCHNVNADLHHIKQIIGLKEGQEYDSVNSLRYGQLIIMTNKDHNGNLIKHLLVNFIRAFWPSLLKIPSFLVEVWPPIVKARHGGNIFYFYDMPQYESWKKSLGLVGEETNVWSIKDYIKEAGNCTKEEAKEWFQNLMFHSLMDKSRYIPSLVDGLNNVQRTILCCAIKHDLVVRTPISEFLSLLDDSASHYDNHTLTRAVIGMATDVGGSNNLNLLGQGGHYGSRINGPKGHAAIEYLYTNLTPIVRLLFPKDDDFLYMNEDGQPIQPNWYAPVIPLVLVNGCQEFGLGSSTSVPNYNPKHLCENVRRLLNGDPLKPIDPWYIGFEGTIEKNGASYSTIGKIDCIDDTTLRITELPVDTWTKNYKEFLDTLCTCTGETEEPFIKSYRDLSDTSIVHFEIKMSKENMELAKKEGLVNKFKLTTTISTDNMLMCDPNFKFKKYDNPEQILGEFFQFRLKLYEKRKIRMLKYLELEQFKLEFKREFLVAFYGGDCTFKAEEDVLIDLKQRDLLTLFQNTSQATCELEVNEARFNRFYEDLIWIDLNTMSESMFKLQEEHLSNQVNELKNTAPEDLWRKDLDVLEPILDELERKPKMMAERLREFSKRRLMRMFIVDDK